MTTGGRVHDLMETIRGLVLIILRHARGKKDIQSSDFRYV